MEEMRKIALAYYNAGTDREKNLFKEFFRSLDEDGNDRVSLKEFSEFLMQQEDCESIPLKSFFGELDRDGSKDLEYYEVLTLYYIIKSGRPFCRQCSRFISELYFTCMKCFSTKSGRYCICLDCYCRYNKSLHCHGLENFLDNFSALEEKRKSVMVAETSFQQSIASVSESFSEGDGLSTGISNVFQSSPSSSESYAQGDVPPTNPERLRRKRKIALKAFQAVVDTANEATNCTIM